MKSTHLLPGMMIMQPRAQQGSWCLGQGTVVMVIGMEFGKLHGRERCSVRFAYVSDGTMILTTWNFVREDYRNARDLTVDRMIELLSPTIDPTTNHLTHDALSYPWTVVSFGTSS